jgi:outer membrane protein OmpA-like peptidoglycan-associated protein
MDIPKRLTKNVFFFFLLFLPVFSVPGQEKNTLSAGILVEANANTRHGYGLAGGLTADYGITNNFALGIKGDFGTDFYDVSSAEALAFGRYYFLNTPLGYPLFVQAGAGLSMLFEKDQSVMTALGEGGIGIRFPIKKFYTEQYLRFGWPAGFGFGIALGYRFDLKPSRPNVQEQRQEDGPVVPDPVLPEPVFYEPPELEFLRNAKIIFSADLANFESMENYPEIFENNINILHTAASFLTARPDYTLTITGHANPVLKTEAEDEESLRPLSLQRAEYIKARLVSLGIEPERISTAGVGGQNADPLDVQYNSRVDFSFENKPPAAPHGG